MPPSAVRDAECRERLAAPPTSQGLPDFADRVDPALLAESMDQPCAYETFRDTMRDLAKVNRLLLAYGPTLRFLHKAIPPLPQRPVTVLDVGFGGGDTLRRIARWAHARRLAVHLAGIDLNPHAARAAQEFSAADPRLAQVQWRTGNVFTDPATQEPDLVLSSLVAHHMRDDEIVTFLRWMETRAKRGWFLSDLVRSRRSYRLYGPLSRLMRWHPFVQHDGLISIRRAFREADWERLLAAAGIPHEAVQVRRCGIGRLCVARLR